MNNAIAVSKNADSLSHMLKEMLDLTFESFMKHRKANLDLVSQLQKQWLKSVPEAAEEMSKQRSVAQVVAIMNGLEFIQQEITHLVEGVSAKIQEGILFSDKAAMELKEIFNVTGELLNHLEDFFNTGNPVIAAHIRNISHQHREKTIHFATEHEERLVKGLCMPRSTTIYLGLLTSLRNILKHIENLTNKI